MDRLKTIVATALVVLGLVLLYDRFLRDRLSGSAGVSSSAQQSEQMLGELKAIHALLERGSPVPAPTAARPAAAAPERVTVSVADGPALGNPQAPVTMVEFTDFQCPFCSSFHKSTFPALKKDFIDTGKVRYVVRDLPLEFHANALKAAQAAHCAGEQGRYWAMHDVLFRNSARLEAARIAGYAAKAGVEPAKFAECIASERHLAGIRASGDDAARLGLSGTPSFVIGKTQAKPVVEGEKLIGAQPLPTFVAALQAAAGGKPR